MAIALVGSAGALAQAAAATISPAFGQATTAGNCLIATVSMSTAGSDVIVCSDNTWTQLVEAGIPALGDTGQASIWAKANCGSGETAPTFSCINATGMVAQLTEWSGTATSSVLDQSGTFEDTATPVTATAGGFDLVAGDLQISAVCWSLDVGGSFTLTDTFGSNATRIVRGTTSGTTTQLHTQFCTAVTTGNGIRDADTASISGSPGIFGVFLAVASIKLFGATAPSPGSGVLNAAELPVLGAARPGPRMF